MIRAPADLFARWSRLQTLAAYGHAPHFLAAVNAVLSNAACSTFRHIIRENMKELAANITLEQLSGQEHRQLKPGALGWLLGNHPWQPSMATTMFYSGFIYHQTGVYFQWRQNMSLIEKLDQVLGISLWSLRYAEINGLFV